MADVVGTIQYDAVIDTSGLKKSARESEAIVKSTSDKIGAALGTKTQGILSRTTGSIRSMAGTIGRDLGNAVKQTASQFVSLGKRIGSLAFKTVIAGLAGVTAAMAGLATHGLKSASTIESLQLSMRGLTKSTKQGNKALGEALKFALASPFQLTDVAATQKTLIAYGLSVEKASKSLKLLGNLSITTGQPIQELGIIFGRVASQGRVMGEDIQQMVQRGIGIMPALQKQLGKTGAEVRKLVSQGKVDFATFQKALASIVDPKIMSQLENTIPRQLDRIKGSLRILSFAFVGVGVDAVKGFTKAKTSIAQAATDILRSVANTMRNPAILEAANAMGTTIALGLAEIPKFIDENTPKIEAFAKRVTAVVNNFNKSIKKNGFAETFQGIGQQVKDAIGNLDFKAIIDKVFAALGNSTQLLTATIVKIITTMDIAPIVAAFVSVIPKLVDGFIRGLFQGLIQGFQKDPVGFITTMLSLVFLPAKVIGVVASLLAKIPLAGPLLAFFTKAINTITGPIRGLLATGFRKAASGAANIIRTVFTGAFNFLRTGASTAVSGAVRIFSGIKTKIVGAMKGAGKWLFDIGKNIINGLKNGITNVAKGVKDVAVNAAKSVVSGVKNFLGIHSPSKVFEQIGKFVGLGFIKGVSGTTLQMHKQVDKQLDSIVKKAKAKLKSLQTARSDFIKDIASSALSGFSIVSTDEGKTSIEAITQQLTNQLTAAQAFEKNLKALQKKGLSKTLVQQLAEAGVTAAGETASALAAGNKTQISHINNLYKNVQKSGTAIGTLVAGNMNKAGIDAMKGLIKGIESQRKALTNKIVSIAKSLTASLKKQLGIKSPSKVFAGIGNNISAGLANGIDAGQSGVKQAIDGLVSRPNAGVGIPDTAQSSLNQPAATANVTVNMNGIMSRSRADERDIARGLVERLNEELRAKGLPEIGGGLLRGGVV